MLYHIGWVVTADLFCLVTVSLALIFRVKRYQQIPTTYLHTEWARQLSSGSSLVLFLFWGGVEKLVFSDYREKIWSLHLWRSKHNLFSIFLSVSHQYTTMLWKTLKDSLQNKIPVLRKLNFKHRGAPIFIAGSKAHFLTPLVFLLVYKSVEKQKLVCFRECQVLPNLSLS